VTEKPGLKMRRVTPPASTVISPKPKTAVVLPLAASTWTKPIPPRMPIVALGERTITGSFLLSWPPTKRRMPRVACSVSLPLPLSGSKTYSSITSSEAGAIVMVELSRNRSWAVPPALVRTRSLRKTSWPGARARAAAVGRAAVVSVFTAVALPARCWAPAGATSARASAGATSRPIVMLRMSFPRISP